MKKILTIARREYQAMVGTKAFALGLAMMPILMLGGMWLPGLLKGFEKSEERVIAVVDHSGQLFAALDEVAKARAAAVAAELAGEESQVDDQSDDATPSTTDPDSPVKARPGIGSDESKKNARKSMGLDDINRYTLELIHEDEFDDESRLNLSEQIRSGDLHAFVEIPQNALSAPPVDPTNPDSFLLPEVVYCAQDAALSDTRKWLETVINQIVRARRMSEAGVPPTVLMELERKTPMRSAGLYTQNEDGTIVSEEKPDELASILLPMGIMMLMFMIVMMSAQPMLESVLEEKTQRISEVLLGSANANQLMTGKLLGNVAGSMTVFAFYAVGAFAVANWKGYADSIPFEILPWFMVYQILAVLMFSSVFMAIGASVSQLREAQSLLLPIWMVMLLPMMVWINVVREPNSSLATGLSFFPPSTPLMMTLRLATGATIPGWQIALSIVVLVLGTYFGVLCASRIYRVGILWQGKTPKLSEMISWLIKNPIS